MTTNEEGAVSRADNLLDSLADPAMAMLIGTYGSPLLGVAWLSFTGVFKYMRTSQTSKFDEFVDSLRKGEFDTKDIEIAGFYEGLEVLFQAFMMARDEIKKSVIKRIIFGFSAATDRQKFQVERLTSDTNSISIEALHFLLFLKAEAIPKMKALFKEDWFDENPTESDKWYKYEPVDPVISEELQNYDPNNKEAQKKYGLDPSKDTSDDGPPENREISAKMWRDQRYKQAEFEDATAELIGKGILRAQSDALGYQDKTVNFFTEYGIEFMNYLFEEDFRK